MAKDKKVEQITNLEDDFAQWYTDICRKAELVEYASVKGFTILRPYGFAIWENMQRLMDSEFKKMPGRQHLQEPAGQPGILVQQPVHGGPLQPEQASRPQSHGRGGQGGLVEQGPRIGEGPATGQVQDIFPALRPHLDQFHLTGQDEGHMAYLVPFTEQHIARPHLGQTARVQHKAGLPFVQPAAQRTVAQGIPQALGIGGAVPFFPTSMKASPLRGRGRKNDRTGQRPRRAQKHRGRPRHGLPLRRILAQDRLEVFVRRGHGHDVPLLHQHLEDVGGHEGRQRGPEADVLHAQGQQGQQDAHGLLFVPPATAANR